MNILNVEQIKVKSGSKSYPMIMGRPCVSEVKAGSTVLFVPCQILVRLLKVPPVACPAAGKRAAIVPILDPLSTSRVKAFFLPPSQRIVDHTELAF